MKRELDVVQFKDVLRLHKKLFTHYKRPKSDFNMSIYNCYQLFIRFSAS